MIRYLYIILWFLSCIAKCILFRDLRDRTSYLLDFVKVLNLLVLVSLKKRGFKWCSLCMWNEVQNWLQRFDLVFSCHQVVPWERIYRCIGQIVKHIKDKLTGIFVDFQVYISVPSRIFINIYRNCDISYKTSQSGCI